MMPAEAFETPTHRKVLRVLSETTRQYTADELAEMCHRTKPTISRTVSRAPHYPFLAVTKIEGSRQKLYGLDSESEYAAPIQRFFSIERERERRNGTVPVDVWNLLEDITVAFADGLDTFLELFLFGSYATGEYYGGSDLDLVLVISGDKTESQVRADNILDRIDPSIEIHLLTAVAQRGHNEDPTVERVRTTARGRAPISNGEPMIPLLGDGR